MLDEEARPPMPERDNPRDGTEAERISPGYSQLLADVVREAGIKRGDLKGKGRSSQVIWRVLEHQEGPTIAAAARLRQKILELRPDLVIPPPAVPIQSAEHYEWDQIGCDLHDRNPVAFRQILNMARMLAGGAPELEALSNIGVEDHLPTKKKPPRR